MQQRWSRFPSETQGQNPLWMQSSPPEGISANLPPRLSERGREMSFSTQGDGPRNTSLSSKRAVEELGRILGTKRKCSSEMKKIHSDHSHNNKNKGQLFWKLSKFPIFIFTKWETHMGSYPLVQGYPPCPQLTPLPAMPFLFSCLYSFFLTFPSITPLLLWRCNEAKNGN